ncbi:MAG: TIGR03067 domain-containing protein [Verrucomicrobia bacterium]|nr:TIGR03067 domain-containing protein [Verrucomicrobiota bacterium]
MSALPDGLTGHWLMIRAENNGEDSSDLAPLKVVLRLEGGSYHVSFGGDLADRGGVAHPAPGALHLTGTEGPNTGRTIPCIFQLMGDRLRICYGLDGTAPEKFTAPAGSGRYLVTYRRHA